MIAPIFAIFLLLLFGYAAKRFGVLHSHDSAVVNSIVVNLTAPAFIFTAIYGHPITKAMLGAPAVVFVSTLLVFSIAYLVSKAFKFDRKTTAGFMLVSAFGNTGFLGYPVTLAAFDKSSHALATAVMVDQFAMSVPLYIFGVAVAASCMTSHTGKQHPLAFLKTPMLVAALLGIALRTVPIPAPLITSLKYLAAATVPLAMISLGLSLSRMALKSVGIPTVVVFALKMASLPLMTFFGLKLLGIHGVVRNTAVLEAAMPPAILNSIIAARYEADREFVASTTFVLTLLSIITLPLIISLLAR